VTKAINMVDWQQQTRQQGPAKRVTLEQLFFTRRVHNYFARARILRRYLGEKKKEQIKG
jgi:hypothetical protein